MRCPTLNELPPPPPGKTGWPWTEESLQLPDAMPDGSPWPKVSIVTPSYNQGQFLEEAIRSVLLQGYPNLEYVIIDGGSDDNSVEIIKKYEPWLAYWISEPDKGQSNAINKGWEQATGEILAWLNSDDTYEPGGINRAVESLLVHPEIGMVYGACNKIDDCGNVIGQCPTMPFNLEALVCNEWFISQPAVFVRQEVIDRVGKVNEDLHLVMDWELWLRIALAGFNIQYLQQTIANFRIWGATKTQSQSERSGQEKLKVLDTLFSKAALPQAFRAVQKKAYSNVHRFIGANYCARSQMAQARHHILKAVTLYPRCLREGNVIKLLLFSLLRKTMAIQLRNWKSMLSHVRKR